MQKIARMKILILLIFGVMAIVAMIMIPKYIQEKQAKVIEQREKIEPIEEVEQKEVTEVQNKEREVYTQTNKIDEMGKKANNIETHEIAHEITIGDRTFNSLNEYLVLKSVSQNDVEKLREMKKIKDLTLSGDYITDISPLSDLTTLEWLTLDCEQVRHFSPLGSLVNLTHLRLDHFTSVDDFSFLCNLPNLESLDLTYTHIGNGLLSFLAQLSQLKSLDLSQNLISDPTPLYNMTNLTELNLMDNDILERDINKLRAALPNCKIYS